MRTVYHLNIDSDQIEGATVALLPGDPGRVQALALHARPSSEGGSSPASASTAPGSPTSAATPVLVTSTGIGGPSASIAIDELAQLGVRTFLRVGTTGAIQEDIDIGTVVDHHGRRAPRRRVHALRADRVPRRGASGRRAGRGRGGRGLGVPFRTGVSASCDTFYPGQERYDSFSGYVPRRFQGITEEWRRLHVLNYEMESSTVLTLTAAMGLRGGCVAGVVVNRARSENVTKADLEIGESNAVGWPSRRWPTAAGAGRAVAAPAQEGAA